MCLCPLYKPHRHPYPGLYPEQCAVAMAHQTSSESARGMRSCPCSCFSANFLSLLEVPITKLPSLSDGIMCQALAFIPKILPDSGYYLLDGPHYIMCINTDQELVKILKILGFSKFLELEVKFRKTFIYLHSTLYSPSFSVLSESRASSVHFPSTL